MKIRSKKLVIALCLLLVSAVMLGTASFAWFSMNTEVAVDGIEVEAYSDSLFLEISKEKTTGYDTSISFAGEKRYLRLAKHGFVSEAYTLDETAISTDIYYDGTTVYYEKVELADSNYKYVVATDLEAPESVAGLYKNPEFVKLGNGETFTDGGVYFEKTGSKYAQLTTVTAGDSAAGYYTLTAIAAEGAGATYDSTADYYKKAGNDYYKVDSIFQGTNVKGYYTLTTLNPTPISDLTAVIGNAFVKTAADEYSLLGDFNTATDISNMLYFGRAYSDTVTDGDKTDALNIIKDGLENYRYTKSIYLRNAHNTNDSRNLQVQFAVGGDSAITNAIRVVLVVYDVTSATPVYVNKVEYSKATDSTVYGTGSNIVNLLAGNEAQTLQVDVFVYYDGSDDIAKNATNGVLELSGNTVDIKFTIDGPDYN